MHHYRMRQSFNPRSRHRSTGTTISAGLFAAIVAVSCARGGEANGDGADSARVDASQTDSTRTDSAARVTTEECVRGEPEPVLAAGKRTDRAPRFQRTGKLEATEEAQLNDSTSLRISHGGCAHFAETYSFTISGAARDSSDVAGWLGVGAAALRSLDVVEDRRSQIDEMAKALDTAAAAKPAYAYGDPISVSEMVTITVTVRRVTNGGVIEILYNNTL